MTQSEQFAPHPSPRPHPPSPAPPPARANRPTESSNPLSHANPARLHPLVRWFKVKVKTSDPTDPVQVGLVPASYLTSPAPIRTVTALFDYAPALNEDGSAENDEEMEIVEGEELILWEDEGDWVLVGRANGKGVGFVPGSYVQASRHHPQMLNRTALGDCEVRSLM